MVKKSGDRRGMASVLGSLGNVYIATGPVEAAHQYLNEGLGMAQELGMRLSRQSS